MISTRLVVSADLIVSYGEITLPQTEWGTLSSLRHET